jgi:hypothetical protein
MSAMRDAEVRRQAVAKVAADPSLIVCPDCDGTGWHYDDDWPYRQNRTTCYRCRGDLAVRPRKQNAP